MITYKKIKILFGLYISNQLKIIVIQLKMIKKQCGSERKKIINKILKLKCLLFIVERKKNMKLNNFYF